LLNVIVEPTHTPRLPEELLMVPGSAFTVTITVAVQPVTGIVFVTVVVPVAIPLKKPVVALIVPTPGLLLLHVPPVTLTSVVLPPTQMPVGPVMGPAPGFTVTTFVT